MPTFQSTDTGYFNLWAKAEIKSDKKKTVDALATKMLTKRPVYDEVSRLTGVPWYFLAVVHVRESNMDFRGVLHNGQRIIGTGKKTTIVPVGRGPFSTWTEAAIDALSYKKLNDVPRWSCERVLYECERWNGWGYVGKVNSPYIWSWTNLYTRGKYVADHSYDPNHVDVQPGCAALLKALEARDPSVSLALSDHEKEAPPNVIKKATDTERKVAGGAAAGAVVTGGTKATVDAPKADAPVTSFAYAYVLPLVIAVFIAVAIVAFVRIRQKTDTIKKVW